MRLHMRCLTVCKSDLDLHCLAHRFRQDCEKLATFVRKIEAFIMQTEDESDMTGPGWQAAFSVSCGLTPVSCSWQRPA